MNPVREKTMLNFLNWVARNRPDVPYLLRGLVIERVN